MKIAFLLQTLIDNNIGFCLQYRPEYGFYNLTINGHYFSLSSKDKLIETLELFIPEDEEEDDL